MKKYYYQLVVFENNNSFVDEVLCLFYKRIKKLGIKKNLINIIRDNKVKNVSLYEPTYCLYFGCNKNKETKKLQDIINKNILILPIVSDFNKVQNELPKSLHKINAIELNKKQDCEKIVSCILEGFRLLRKTRRVFISYKRDESSTVALQLFEALERNGFDVFIDTHSIRPADNFQDELFHRMADCDLVIMLHTEKFFDSKWTKEEFEKANSMSIGIVQIVWPKVEINKSAELFIPYKLKVEDFNCRDLKNKLITPTINKIISVAESIRVRSLASRQTNIVGEFVKEAQSNNIEYIMQPNNTIILKNYINSCNKLIIPTVGIPQSDTYNYSREFIEDKIKEIFILYDHRNIREKWIEYLNWLNIHLPIKTKKITEVSKWIRN